MIGCDNGVAGELGDAKIRSRMRSQLRGAPPLIQSRGWPIDTFRRHHCRSLHPKAECILSSYYRQLDRQLHRHPRHNAGRSTEADGASTQPFHPLHPPAGATHQATVHCPSPPSPQSLSDRKRKHGLAYSAPSSSVLVLIHFCCDRSQSRGSVQNRNTMVAELAM